MSTTSLFVAKPIPEVFRVGSRVDVHSALISLANEQGVLYTTNAEFAVAAGLSNQVAYRGLTWLQEHGLITYEPGNRGRKGVIQLVAEELES